MLVEVHERQMNRWSWELNQQGDKAEIAVSRGGKQETPVGGVCVRMRDRGLPR